MAYLERRKFLINFVSGSDLGYEIKIILFCVFGWYFVDPGSRNVGTSWFFLLTAFNGLSFSKFLKSNILAFINI